MEEIEKALKEKLCDEDVKQFGVRGGGCVCTGQGYQTSNDDKIYVKMTSDSDLRAAEVMFEGEYQSLKAINDTSTVKVPRPLFVINTGSKAALATEYLDIRSLSPKHSVIFGNELGRMHKHNELFLLKANTTSIHDRSEAEESFSTTKFGFHVPTCCGKIPQENEWMDNWVEFFCQQRLECQINLVGKNYGDRQALQLWSELQLKIPKYFQGLDNIKPALVHGDMWSGNVGQIHDKPVLFDPSSFYGHSEYEFGIATMYSSHAFNRSFYDAYHKLVPKSKGFDSRQKLYQLFHYLNHWNHFGGSYRGSSISIMKLLVNESM